MSHGIVADAKSGVSGAGKAPTAKTHYMYAADNLSAYGVFNHRHTGELLEQIGIGAGDIVFTPHLLPIPRGIMSTIYVRFKEAQTHESVAKIYREFFASSPMVRIYEKSAAADSVFGAHEFRGYRVSDCKRWAARGDCELPRQSAEGRIRTGGAEHERDARLGRSGGAGMKYVVKLGGAGLEIPELLQGCVRAITDLVRDGHQVAVVHGGGVQLTRMMERLGAQERVCEWPARHRCGDAQHRADGFCRQGE